MYSVQLIEFKNGVEKSRCSMNYHDRWTSRYKVSTIVGCLFSSYRYLNPCIYAGNEFDYYENSVMMGVLTHNSDTYHYLVYEEDKDNPKDFSNLISALCRDNRIGQP